MQAKKLTRSLCLHEFVDGNGKLHVSQPPLFGEQKNKVIIKACESVKY